MEKNSIIAALQRMHDDIRKKYRADIKGIFGSVAREENITGSDLDILVSFEKGANMFDFVGLSQFLEESLHLPVDIVPIDVIRNEIKEQILREAIYI